MTFFKRLSIGNQVVEPLADLVDLGLNTIGSASFEVRADRIVGLKPKDACRLYVGRTDKVTFLMFQGTVKQVDTQHAGTALITVRQRCVALEQELDVSLTNCTAHHVLQEVVDATGIPFATAAPGEPGSTHVSTKIPRFSSTGPLTGTLDRLGAAFGVPDAVWYEQPDRRVFWGSWVATPMAQAPLPLEGNVILERDANGHGVRIPLVPSLRPGMLVRTDDREFRIEKLQMTGDTMRLEWRPGIR
ncbi:MAG TPA: hypothetical protein VF678_11650 [bacterium]